MKKIISTSHAPAAIGPYAQAVVNAGLVYTSGQLGIDPQTGKLDQGIQAQAHAAFKNLGAILNNAGTDWDGVLKTTVFLSDMAHFTIVNEIYAQYFTRNFPARSCFQVANLPLDGLIEIECIAVVSPAPATV